MVLSARPNSNASFHGLGTEMLFKQSFHAEKRGKEIEREKEGGRGEGEGEREEAEGETDKCRAVCFLPPVVSHPKMRGSD